MAGASCIDITPPPGLAMAGFAARTRPARAIHDRLTVRAVAVEDTAIACVDVCALDDDFCARVRARCEGAVVVTALHTHGGPCTTPGRLGGPTDARYLSMLEDACVAAVAEARAARLPCTARFATAADPGIGRNRRRPDGPRDASLPVLQLEHHGRPIATILAHACHPVVLGADNLAWTADYPHFVRAGIETARPGTVCLFLTGCTGDVNTGHSAHASMSNAPAPRRTFAEAERLGALVAASVLAADLEAIDGPTYARSTPLSLALADGSPPWHGRVSLLRWSGVAIACLPGEPFARTGLDLRAHLGPASMALGFADGCPGYFPTEDEYILGGYEVEEAHRYYGMPAAFAPGSAERLVKTILGTN